MPAQYNAKSLYLLRYLYRHTDEDHPASTGEIIDALQADGIELRRHSIPDMIAQLQEYGIDIICSKGSPNRYFVGERLFELPELKLLVDAVESSRFIPEKKSRALVNKLMSLTSVHRAEELNRSLYIDGRVKTESKTLYYTVDTIHRAINEKKKITFRYIEYTAEKKKVFKHGGFVYTFSPYALLWHNDFYYVLGYSEKHGEIVKFRVDRIDNAELTEQKSVPKPKGFDPVVYLKNIFSMYDGEMRDIRLLCKPDMMKVIMDKFGKDVITSLCEDGGFVADVKASISPTFFGWVFGMGGKVKLIHPKDVVAEYEYMVRSALE